MLHFKQVFWVLFRHNLIILTTRPTFKQYADKQVVSGSTSQKGTNEALCYSEESLKFQSYNARKIAA